MGLKKCFFLCIISIQILRNVAILPIPRVVDDILDPELREEFAIIKHGGYKGFIHNFSGEEIVGSTLNLRSEKRDLSQESDLWGDPVKLKERQLGKSQVKEGPDGQILGHKEPGAFVPWRKPYKFTTSTTEEPTEPPEPDIPYLERIMPKYIVRASSLFGACGKPGGRTCFAYPDGCMETKKCRIAAAIHEEDDDPRWVKISLAATAPHGFVAIGFSEDRFMGDDVVVYCNHIQSGPQMTLHLAWNKGYENIMQKDPEKFKSTLSPTAGFAQSNSVIACEFDMSTFVFLDDGGKTKGKKVNLIDNTKDYHIFIAYGRYYDTLDMNDTDFGQMRFHHLVAVSKEKIKFLDIFAKPTILHARSTIFIILHIIPSILAFSFFEPCAIFIAKYGREAYGHLKTSRNIPLWLLIHMSFQLIAMILSVFGLLFIIIELGGTWRSISGKAIFHSVFGIFATVFLWFNALFAGFGLGTRGKKAGTDSDQPYHYFRWMHWYFGNCVYLFGMGCLYIAPYMRRAHAPCVLQYVACLQILVHVGTHIFMSFHTYWMVHKLDGKHLARRTFPGPMVPWFPEDFKESKKTDTVFYDMRVWCDRRRAVIFYFVTSAICCIGMIVLMFVPMVLCLQT